MRPCSVRLTFRKWPKLHHDLSFNPLNRNRPKVATINPKNWAICLHPNMAFRDYERTLRFFFSIGQKMANIPEILWIKPSMYWVVTSVRPNDTPALGVLIKIEMNVLSIAFYSVSWQPDNSLARRMSGTFRMGKAHQISNSIRILEYDFAPPTPCTHEPNVTVIRCHGRQHARASDGDNTKGSRRVPGSKTNQNDPQRKALCEGESLLSSVLGSSRSISNRYEHSSESCFDCIRLRDALRNTGRDTNALSGFQRQRFLGHFLGFRLFL
jgi:hypothetical protein